MEKIHIRYNCQINEESVCIDTFKIKLTNRLEVVIYIINNSNVGLDVKNPCSLNS